MITRSSVVYNEMEYKFFENLYKAWNDDESLYQNWVKEKIIEM